MLKVNELFAGIGAWRKALDRLGIDYEVVGISEIDCWAIQSYNAIFGETRNYGDIRNIPKLDYADLWVYSSPCQDISIAGLQKGIGKDTRSGLIYEVGRLLKVAESNVELPKYLILENVRNLVGKKFKPEFDRWNISLSDIGYNTYFKVLNAKKYGIPQNRERVFAISIRKDIDTGYTFPEEVPLMVKLKDLLQDDVDEKFYVPENRASKLIETLNFKDVSSAVRIGGRQTYDKKHGWDLVKVREATKQGYSIAKAGDSINLEQPNSKTRRGRVGKEVAQTLTTAPQMAVICASRGRNPDNPSDRTTGCPTEQRLELNMTGCSNTITSVQKDNLVLENRLIRVGDLRPKGAQDSRVYSTQGISPALVLSHPPHVQENIRIRRLTPLECWRLMDFDDEDFNKAKASGVSDTQLYKQAGNAIVVRVVEKVLENLLK